jgi:hypothetical protein
LLIHSTDFAPLQTFKISSSILYTCNSYLFTRSQPIEGPEKQARSESSFSNICQEALRQLSPQLKAITLRITDSFELSYGTGILRRVARLITSSELIPSSEDALDARVEVPVPGAADLARHELVRLSTFM